MPLLLAVTLVRSTTFVAASASGPGGNDASASEDAGMAANAGMEEDALVAMGSGPHAAMDTDGLFPDGLLMLVLIVKDEATSIEDILRSSMPWCETYYIMDTGSTDGTQDIIRRVMTEMGKPGLLEEEPFVDFATTRNLALERSGTGTMYKLFIDGDWFIDGAEQLRFYLEKNVAPYKRMMAESPTGCQPCRPCYNGGDATDGMTCRSELCMSCAPVWMMRLILGTLDYYVPRVIRSNTVEQFVGVVHEVIGPHASPRLPRNSLIVVNATETNREHSRQRWLRDEKLLEKELEKDPTDSRSAFYLAQTYMLIDKPELALEMNLRRVRMGGWSQERYMALNRAGDNAIASGKGFEEAKKHWLAAYEMDPNRVETIYKIAREYKETQDNMPLCAFYAIMATQKSYPNSKTLFIHGGTYDFDRWDLLGICAWYADEYELGFAALVKALDERPHTKHTYGNLAFYRGHVEGVDAAIEKYGKLGGHLSHDEL